MRTAFAIAAVMLMLAACGGGGSGSKPISMTQQPTQPVDTDGDGVPDAQNAFPNDSTRTVQLKIVTSFGTTKTDHFPLNAKLIRQADTDENCCWEMIKEESEIASRADVLAMFREEFFNYSPYLVECSPEWSRDLCDRHQRDSRSWIVGYRTPPIVRFFHNTSSQSRAVTLRAIDNINAWLPYEKHITVGNDFFDKSVVGNLVANPLINIITATFDEDMPYAGAGGLRLIEISPWASESIFVIQHELLHAMGLFGGGTLYGSLSEEEFRRIEREGLSNYYDHVPVFKFPESEMAYASPYYAINGLSQIDGEMLQAIYTREELWGAVDEYSDPNSILFRIDLVPTDLGSWDDSVIRYAGRIDSLTTGTTGYGSGDEEIEAGFGVDWRNGMARPWADGWVTEGTFAESGLSGTATWTGELVGFTPTQEAVHGDSAIEVDLRRMTGEAAFTALEHWNAGARPGARGTGAQWNDGDLHYSLGLDGNFDELGGLYLRSNGGDDGYVSGRFVGAQHEGVVGILERPDLTGAFGATR